MFAGELNAAAIEQLKKLRGGSSGVPGHSVIGKNSDTARTYDSRLQQDVARDETGSNISEHKRDLPISFGGTKQSLSREGTFAELPQRAKQPSSHPAGVEPYTRSSYGQNTRNNQQLPVKSTLAEALMKSKQAKLSSSSAMQAPSKMMGNPQTNPTRAPPNQVLATIPADTEIMELPAGTKPLDAVNMGYRYFHENATQNDRLLFQKLLDERDRYVESLVEEIHQSPETFLTSRLPHLEAVAQGREERTQNRV